MKEEQDYVRDIADIRSMMERSSRFVLISSWAGILAGLIALMAAGLAHFFLPVRAFIDYRIVAQDSNRINYEIPDYASARLALYRIILLGLVTLILAASAAVITCSSKAKRNGVKIWTPTTRRLLTHILVPMFAGGILILIFGWQGWYELMIPLSLLFYGLALFSASKFTYDEVRILGLVEIFLGLMGCCFLEHGLLLWAIGFGLVHIAYGIFVHFKYER